jgi:hypothetical protein
VYYNIRNILPKSGTFLLGHPVYKTANTENDSNKNNKEEFLFEVYTTNGWIISNEATE